MKISRHIFPLVLVALVTLILASCGSSKKAAGPVTDYQSYNAKELSQKLADEASMDWKGLKVPVKVRVSGMSVGGTMTMVRDESIYISMRMFGFEVATALITNDSIYAYAKMQKMYLAESIPDLLAGFPATVGNLQSLILGQIFTLGSDKPNLRQASISDGNGMDGIYTIQPRSPGKGLTYEFSVDHATNQLRSLAFSVGGKNAVVAYEDPVSTIIGNVGRQLLLNVKTSSKNVNGELQISADDIELGQFDTRTFSAPRGAKRVTAASLLKVVQNL